MFSRESPSTIEFVNKSDCVKVEITLGDQTKTINSKGATTKFEILESSQTVVKAFDIHDKLCHEAQFTINHLAAYQTWKITSTGLKHKRSAFFTENHNWIQKF